MVGLLSGLFNVTVCVVFPIAIFLIILTRSKNAKTELKVFLVGVCTYGQYILGKPANGLGNRAIYQPAAS